MADKQLQQAVVDSINNGTFFDDYSGTIVTLGTSQQTPLDQAWTASTNPLNPSLFWSGFKTTTFPVQYVIQSGNKLTSTVAADGLYTGEYDVTVLDSSVYPSSSINPNSLVVSISMRLRVPNRLDDGTTIEVMENAVTTMSGTMTFVTFPPSQATSFFDRYPSKASTCSAGEFLPTIVCNAYGLRTDDSEPKSSPSTVAIVGISFAVLAFVVALVCIIWLGVNTKAHVRVR